MLKIGDKIELERGMKYQIVKCYEGGIYDLKALQPLFEWMPNFYPDYYSIKLEQYKLITD